MAVIVLIVNAWRRTLSLNHKSIFPSSPPALSSHCFLPLDSSTYEQSSSSRGPTLCAVFEGQAMSDWAVLAATTYSDWYGSKAEVRYIVRLRKSWSKTDLRPTHCVLGRCLTSLAYDIQ